MDGFDPLALGQRALANDFFLGGLGLGLVGSTLALARLLWGRTLALAWLLTTVSLTVDNRMPAFRHLLLFLEAEGVLKNGRRLRISTFSRSGGYGLDESDVAMMTPDEGSHWFLRGRVIGRLERDIDPKTRVDAHAAGEGPLETITLTLPRGNRALFADWIAAGARIANSRARLGPRIHTLAGDYWQDGGEVPARGLETVVAEDDAIEHLAADLRRFLGAARWYAERGVPWRRGYLLHGPPGTGKSSLIRALASSLELDIATADLGRKGLDDDTLRRSLAEAPRNALLVFEDIDAVYRGREAEEAGSTARVSFSGLLNAIDGVAAQEGRALIMTTNHPERLDPALIRPGRADVHLELGPLGALAAAAMYRRFFPGEEALAARFAAGFGAARRAPAEIQGWLLAHAEDPVQAANATAFLAGKTGRGASLPPTRLTALPAAE
ncbi:MAG: AAA family ATPase [Pseudomonadota bacterium]